jgi:hypothetical protein
MAALGQGFKPLPEVRAGWICPKAGLANCVRGVKQGFKLWQYNGNQHRTQAASGFTPGPAQTMR